MSFWKCWISTGDEKNNKDYLDNDLANNNTMEKQRDKNQMSVSRSGRYKQRQRRRSGILDNPGLRKLLEDASSRPQSPRGDTRQNGTCNETVEKCDPINAGSVDVEKPEIEINWQYPELEKPSVLVKVDEKGLILSSKSLPDMRVV